MQNTFVLGKKPLVYLAYKYQNKYPQMVNDHNGPSQHGMAFRAADMIERGAVKIVGDGHIVHGHKVVGRTCDCTTYKIETEYGPICTHRLAVMMLKSPTYKNLAINERLDSLIKDLINRGDHVALLLQYEYSDPDIKIVIGYRLNGIDHRFPANSGERFSITIDQLRHSVYFNGMGIKSVTMGSGWMHEFVWNLMKGSGGIVITDELWMRRDKSEIRKNAEQYIQDFRKEVMNNGNNLGVSFPKGPKHYSNRDAQAISDIEPPIGSWWS